MSTLIEINFGVPQGCMLGPLLFTIYINEVCSLPRNGKICSFEGDFVLIFEGNYWNDTHFKVEIVTKTVVKQWPKENLLTLNDINGNVFINSGYLFHRRSVACVRRELWAS